MSCFVTFTTPVLYKLTNLSPTDKTPLWKSTTEAPPFEPPAAKPFLANSFNNPASVNVIKLSVTKRPHLNGVQVLNLFASLEYDSEHSTVFPRL